MPKNIDKMALLKALEPIALDRADSKDQAATQLSLGSALRQLADLTHEREYTLCTDAAKHLLGTVPEPDDADLGEEDLEAEATPDTADVNRDGDGDDDGDGARASSAAKRS
jgi:hypothetical protein